MIVPNFENDKFVNSDGYLTEKWSNILQSLFSMLKHDLGKEGFVVPALTTDNTSLIEESSEVSTLVYDTNIGSLKIKLNDGMFHDITTS